MNTGDGYGYRYREATASSTYTVSGKKRPEYFGHNFDQFKHNFVIFGTDHLDTSTYSIIGKFIPTLQHLYVEMTSYVTSSKVSFTYKYGHLTKTVQLYQ